MDNQEAFTIARRGLLKQMEKSQIEVGKDHPQCVPEKDREGKPNLVCAYRGPNGLKCGVGFLVSDEEMLDADGNLNKGLNESSVSDALDEKFFPSLEGVAVGLLESLQCIHDQNPPSDWSAKLEALAEVNDLKIEED